MRYILLCFCLTISQAWANSHALYNYDTKEYITKQNVESIHSIASITKLFTAMTILESGVELDKRINVECRVRGSNGKNIEMSRRDLLTVMIVASDNCAADTLANDYPNGYSSFVQARTKLIKNMGLKNTRLHDATGLSVFNSSTVSDLITFAPIAYGNLFLRSISNLPAATVRSVRKGKETVIKVYNTNPSVYNHKEIVISKTGFTNSAGRCVLMMVKKLDYFYAVIVLGEPTVRARTKQAERLLNYENRNK